MRIMDYIESWGGGKRFLIFGVLVIVALGVWFSQGNIKQWYNEDFFGGTTQVEKPQAPKRSKISRAREMQNLRQWEDSRKQN